MRRVRGFTVDVDLTSDGAIAWALVYVPEGIPAGNVTLNVSEGGQPASFYTPEQHVICQGVATSAASSRTFNRFGRSLASNDTVYFVARNLMDDVTTLALVCRFAIAFL
jgi:hypothetical protein